MFNKLLCTYNRFGHSTHIVGHYLYMWRDAIDGHPKVHDNDIKQRMTSVIGIFHLSIGMWEQRPTNGKSPLGIACYTSTVITRSTTLKGVVTTTTVTTIVSTHLQQRLTHME